MYKLLLLLLLSSCSIFQDNVQTFENSPYPREEVLSAFYDFEKAWHIKFNHRVSDDVKDIDIRFEEKSADCWTRECVRGRYTRGTDYIEIWYPDKGEFPIEDSSIWHELVHVVLSRSYGDLDSNHHEPGGPWTNEHWLLLEDLKY